MTASATDLGFTPRRPEVLDGSMLAEYAKCPSRFYLRYILGLRIKHGGESVPLAWGSKWHELMYAYNKENDLIDALLSLEPWPRHIDGSDKQGRTMARMALIFTDYVDRFSERDLKTIEVIRREQYFNIHIEQGQSTPYGASPVSIDWCGRLDRLERIRKHLYVRDYKTTGAMGTNYFDEHKNGFQLLGYTIATSLLTDERPRGMMLDVAYTLKASHDFHRREFRYTPDHAMEWLANTKRWVDRINRDLDDHLDDPDAWLQNRVECTKYRLCSFAGVHFTPNFDGCTRWDSLREDYMEDRWDPSDGLV